MYNQKDVFISIGGGKFQKPLIEAIKDLGFDPIVLVNKTQSKSKEQNIIPVDITSYNALKKAITSIKEQYNLKGLYARSYGKVIENTNKLLKTFSFPYNPTQSFKILYNKKYLKKFLKENHIPTAKRKILGKKIVIRHIKKHGKSGVYIKNGFSLKALLPWYLSEEFLDGKEYIAYFFIYEGNPYPLIISQKTRAIDLSPSHKSFVDIFHWIRYPNSKHTIDESIFSIANKVVSKLDLKFGPLIIEFIWKNNTPYIIEIVPEYGGEFLADYAIPIMYPKLNIFHWIVSIISKKEFKPDLERSNKNILIKYLYPIKCFKTDNIQTIPFKENFNFLIYYDFFYKKNINYCDKKGNLKRFGVIILEGKNFLELRKKWEVLKRENEFFLERFL